MRNRPGVIFVLLGALLALGAPAAATPFVVTDKAFVDNRQPNDPLATGLFLNLGVGFTDSPVTNPTATGTSSNVAFPFGPIPMALDFPLSPGGASFGASFNLTPAQFSSITGTYTFHVCDTNGCVNDT